MAGGGFYTSSGSIARNLQAAFETDNGYDHSIYPHHSTRVPHAQWETNQSVRMNPGLASNSSNSFEQLFQSRMDVMMDMISSTQKLVFDQHASQKKLEEKVDMLAQDLDQLKQELAVKNSTPDSGRNQSTSRSRVPFELSVSCS